MHSIVISKSITNQTQMPVGSTGNMTQDVPSETGPAPVELSESLSWTRYLFHQLNDSILGTIIIYQLNAVKLVSRTWHNMMYAFSRYGLRPECVNPVLSNVVGNIVLSKKLVCWLSMTFDQSKHQDITFHIFWTHLHFSGAKLDQ